MKFSTLYRLQTAPFLAWGELAFVAGEMMLASAQVIGHRATAIALAGPTRSAGDQREFSLMIGEKFSATAESAQAVAFDVIGMTQQFCALALKQAFAGTAASLSLASSRTTAQFQARQVGLIRDTVVNAGSATSELSRASARVVAKGLQPIHSRVKRNAKRLAKR